MFIILTFQGYNLTFLDILYYSIINTIIVIILSIFIIFTRVDERTFRAYKTGSSKGCTQWQVPKGSETVYIALIVFVVFVVPVVNGVQHVNWFTFCASRFLFKTNLIRERERESEREKEKVIKSKLAITFVNRFFFLLVAPGSPQEKVVAIPNLGKKNLLKWPGPSQNVMAWYGWDICSGVVF